MDPNQQNNQGQFPQPQAPQQPAPQAVNQVAYQYAQNTMPQQSQNQNAPQQVPYGQPTNTQNYANQQMPPQAMPQQQPIAQQIPTGQAPQSAPDPKVKKSNPNSTQNTLLITEIRDGVVILNDGSFRSVILTKSINFDLMSPQERESVEYAYQGFLNSLYYDIQIFIRSQKVDIRPYIERLDKLRLENENMLLALMMEDYIDFIQLLAQETNIMDKQFYIVVPFYLSIDKQRAVDQSKKLLGGIFSRNEEQKTVTINEADLEKAKTELKNRVQSVMSGLQQMGVQSIPLDTEELIELYYDSYNPDTATRQHIKDFSQLNAPVISKGAGDAFQPHLEKEMQ